MNTVANIFQFSMIYDNDEMCCNLKKKTKVLANKMKNGELVTTLSQYFIQIPPIGVNILQPFFCGNT